MRKTITLIASLVFTLVCEAQTIDIHMVNGTVVKFHPGDVDYVAFMENSTPDGVEAVDLGLPSGNKWANMNIGATKPDDYGLYFLWGETEGHTAGYYSFWTNYKWCSGSEMRLTKYCTDPNYGPRDGNGILDTEDDAARVNWGGYWAMPSLEDVQELIANTTSEWVVVNGVNGRRFTSKTNSNSIFLPAAGRLYQDKAYDVGTTGFYKTTSLCTVLPTCVLSLVFESNWIGADPQNGYSRDNANPIRPVLKFHNQ